MHDLLGKLNILSMPLQEQDSSPIDILDRINSVVTSTYLADTVHWGGQCKGFLQLLRVIVLLIFVVILTLHCHL